LSKVQVKPPKKAKTICKKPVKKQLKVDDIFVLHNSIKKNDFPSVSEVEEIVYSKKVKVL
jgi:hypothetical protein